MSRVQRTYLVLAFVVAVVPFRTFAAPTWLKLETDDFVLLSDASAKEVAEFAVGYAAYRHAWQEFFSPAKPPPSKVLLFRRLSTLHEYLPPAKDSKSELISFTTEVDAEALLALSVGGDRQQAFETTFEFETIWALRRTGYFLPLWMSQGTGEVFSSLEFRKNRCVLGSGPYRLSSLWDRLEILPWERFFEVNSDSPEYNGEKAGMFHAQAWALMHRILLDDEKGRERFEALAAKLANTDGLEAVQSLLSEPAKEFSRDIEHHLARRRPFEISLDEVALRGRLKVIPAPEVEVHVQLANLLVAGGKFTEAETELRRAEAISPDASAVKEALARRALREDHPESAAQLYRDAIAAGSVDPVAYLVSADQRMNATSAFGTDQAGGGGDSAQVAIEEIRRAIALNPGSTNAYRLLGRAFYLRPTISADDIAELSRGISPDKEGAGVRFYRALLFDRLNLKPSYLEDLRRLASTDNTPHEIRKQAQSRLAAEEFGQALKQIEQLVHEHRYQDARAVITKAESTEIGRGALDKYEQVGRWISENEDWEALNSLYEQRKWSETRAAAKEFLEKYPKSRATADAHKIEALANEALDKLR